MSKSYYNKVLLQMNQNGHRMVVSILYPFVINKLTINCVTKICDDYKNTLEKTKILTDVSIMQPNHQLTTWSIQLSSTTKVYNHVYLCIAEIDLCQVITG